MSDSELSLSIWFHSDITRCFFFLATYQSSNFIISDWSVIVCTFRPFKPKTSTSESVSENDIQRYVEIFCSGLSILINTGSDQNYMKKTDFFNQPVWSDVCTFLFNKIWHTNKFWVERHTGIGSVSVLILALFINIYHQHMNAWLTDVFLLSQISLVLEAGTLTYWFRANFMIEQLD